MKNLIIHGYVVTVNKDFDIIRDGGVCYEGNRILAVGSSEDLLKQYPDAEITDAKGMVVMPGLVNTHLHSGLIRGMAEDCLLWDWLSYHIDPAHKALLPEDAYAASRLCYSEALLSGTTTLNDMYRFIDRCADAAVETGIRACLASYVGDRAPYDFFDSVDDNERVYLERNGDGDGRISIWFGIEHIAYVKEESFARIAMLAEKYNTGIHVHGEESVEMNQKIWKEYGHAPIVEFYKRGILTPKTVVAHCVWLNPMEIEIMAKTGASIAHCPTCNAKLASGVAPIPQALAAGVNVGIGSDGIKENNNVDLLEEMKISAIVNKLYHQNTLVLPAEEMVRMATICGAKALGLEEEIGSLEPGKKADIILVDFDKLHLYPHVYGKYENIISNLVYSAQGGDVDTTIVDGITRVKHHKLVAGNDEEIKQAYQKAVEGLIERREPFIPDAFDLKDMNV